MINKDAATTLTVPSDTEIVIERSFNAPPSLVFAAWTKPKHVRRWYGLHFLTMTVCEIDLRVGGKWRYVLQGPDGSEHSFSGEYKEIMPPERLVYSEGYEAMPGHDYLVTTSFREENGKTRFTSTMLYQSKADRDGHAASGMEPGMRETLDRLEQFLITLA